MIVISGNIRYILETLDSIYRIYTQDIQPLVCFSMMPKCMTLNDPE